jgi:hypothetical protein
MEDYKKFADALNNLKPEAGFCYRDNYPMTEEKYATVEWMTGVEADGETAITTTVNPHPELTWSAVNAEMTRLQTEYDAQDYARKRQAEYPSVQDLVVALYDTDDKAAIEAKRAEVKAKYLK